MLPLGTQAPPFRLPDTTGQMVSLEDTEGAPALVVMFICNHCPYVKYIQHELARFGREYQAKGVAIIAINSNDAQQYPDDSPGRMAEVAASVGYTFPYLYDETQQVAQAYQAACTPDFYVFDKDRRLVYRGQFDGARPGNNQPITGADLRAAVDQLLAGKPVSQQQLPSAGCNIKWKTGNTPEYAGAGI